MGKLRSGAEPNRRGGARPGAGRPSDDLIRRVRALVDKHKIVEFIASVASGEEEEADVKDRLRAAEMLLDRGWGKPSQALELNGDVSGRLVIVRAQNEG